MSELSPFLIYFLAAPLVLASPVMIRNALLLATPVLAALHLFFNIESGMSASFTVLEFGHLTSLPDETYVPGIVYLELSDAEKYIDSSDDVAYHLSRFERLWEQALEGEETVDLLRTAASDL